VPVFIQSNIGKVYVVGVGKGNRKRIELPLWELTLRKSKSQAKKYADSLKEYRYMYASVKLDGLPMRAEPENTARQVYRLKEGQKIKILKKGAGTPVLVGSTALDGDWLEVMADDGTTGWCFSYNLTVFDERESLPASVSATASGPDTALEALLGQSWYPDSLRLMVEANRVDIDRIDPQWGFFPGNDAGVARLVSGAGTVTFPYSTIERGDNGTYRFIGSSLTVQVRRQDTILVQYTDANGMPQAAYFAALSTAPDAIIQAERDRRDAILAKIRKSGPRFASGNYGALRFLSDGKFAWDGWQLLSPAIIPADAGSGGSVDIRCFLDPAPPQTMTACFPSVRAEGRVDSFSVHAVGGRTQTRIRERVRPQGFRRYDAQSDADRSCSSNPKSGRSVMAFVQFSRVSSPSAIATFSGMSPLILLRHQGRARGRERFRKVDPDESARRYRQARRRRSRHPEGHPRFLPSPVGHRPYGADADRRGRGRVRVRRLARRAS
jgi:hypothetical protein